MASAVPRTITILHWNDAYDIEPRKAEPVGGAARLVAKVRSFGPDALVLHSGDAYSPSMLSTITQGRQMVEIMNACGVAACCVGNHDLDYGVENFEQRAAECRFPWLMANVIDAESGAPLGGAKPSLLLDWRGVRLGLIGLVEQEWLTTLASVEEGDVRYLDFVAEGARLAAELRAQGAELVVALTHMRLPNDLRLAGGVPGVDLVLGGHDHDYFLLRSAPHGTVVVKSGTDFQDLTEIRVTLAPGGAPAPAPAPAGAGDAAALPSPGAHRACVPGLAGTPVGSPSAPSSPRAAPSPRPCSPGAAAAAAAASVYEALADASLATTLRASRAAGAARGPAAPTVTVECVRHSIVSQLPEDPEVATIVERYQAQMGERMEVVVGCTAIDLDGRFATVRTGESNLGNLVCDVWREACKADAALLNGGTLRSDRVHPAGPLTHRDLVSVLPMLDETVVIQVTGAQLAAALENGVSEWPKHEGRFPQVSGIRFAFDSAKPPGSRVVEVSVGGAPLQPEQVYSLATKQYLAEGKDGYDSLAGSPLLCDCDCTPLLPNVVANHFLLLRMANRYLENTGRMPAWRRAADRLLRGSQLYAHRSQDRLQEAGVSHTARRHPASGLWEVAPVVDGRIRRVGDEAGSASGGGDGSGGGPVH